LRKELEREKGKSKENKEKSSKIIFIQTRLFPMEKKNNSKLLA